MKVSILGAGNMGSAFAQLVDIENKVVMYSIEDNVDEINNYHTNKKYVDRELNENIKVKI